jgi:spore germination protein GerM
MMATKQRVQPTRATGAGARGSKAAESAGTRFPQAPAAAGLLLLVPVVLLALSACAAGGGTGGAGNTSAATPTSGAASPTAQPSAEATTAAGGTTIKVYFSKFPVSTDTDFSAVFPVERISLTTGVATYSIQMLIAGPTQEERSQGYFSELNSMLTGPSTCNGSHPTGGPDFTITLNTKGSTPETNTATLRFCRQTQSSGTGMDARVVAEITATLTQFSNIKKVVLLTSAGHCFADESGADQCLA